MRVLAGRYELAAFVGRGGMGEVWAGRDRVIGRHVAVKLLPHNQGDPSGAELFFREARTAGGLNHRGVVTVHDMGQDPADGTLFLVMEYIEGRDLAAVLRQDGPPPVADAVGWAAQGAAALAAAHAAGIVHRDLKPANLMLTTGGEIKILDFGIARYMAASDKSSKVMGTLAYMAPERFDEQSGDARSDLYAFGCVLHELLTGSTPFEATGPVAMMTAHLNKAPAAPGTLRPDVPPALDALVLSLLAKSPRDRPASASEVHDALRALAAVPAAEPVAPASPPPAALGAPDDLPAEPPPGFGPSPDPLHSLPTETAAAPPPGPPRPIATAMAADPVATAEEGQEPRHPSRRRALWLGLGAAALAATGTTAALLSRDGNHGTPSAGPGSNTGAPSGGKPSPGPRGWRFEAKTVLPTPPVLSAGTLRFTDGHTIYGLDALTGAEQAQVAVTKEVGELTAAEGMLFFADSDGKVHGRSGSERWVFAAGDFIPGRLAVSKGRVFFGSKDGKIYAVDANAGMEFWNFPTGDKVFCAPTVAEETVYIGVAGTEPGLYALSTVDGRKKWAFREGGLYFKTPAVADGLVFATANDDTLYAVDTATGAKRWSVPLKREAGADPWFRPSPPVVAGDTVYVGGGDKALHALDAKTGAKKWTYDINGPFIPSTPTVVDGRVYVADLEDMYGTVYALDATDGFQKWTARTGARIHAQNMWNAPLIANGLVYVTNENGLLAINATTGDLPA
ncbi:serine/threonine-protein kinase [Streptomyces sp. NBC_00503]|uniref:serine/threonine-protein kinase n=1 Tax=Streptomyces sp. NBC_00503 TaxID=2903659 RepID=UPI002E80E144|nr:serine/threonine-protein kinase [Streptomyces sp. NBC_00503]WUD83329.1 serine/threonine-protein kinase [Streptomyces sp. NBC_00503]